MSKNLKFLCGLGGVIMIIYIITNTQHADANNCHEATITTNHATSSHSQIDAELKAFNISID